MYSYNFICLLYQHFPRYGTCTTVGTRYDFKGYTEQNKLLKLYQISIYCHINYNIKKIE
jgi:hypothetical protein